MNPILVAMLMKFAEEAGKSAGRELADRIIDLLFGQLATQEDLDRAVAEIRRYIDQAFEDMKVFEFLANVDGARIALVSFAGGHTKEAVDRAIVNSENALKYLAPRSAIAVGEIRTDTTLPPSSGRFLSPYLAVATGHIAALVARATYFPTQNYLAELKAWVGHYKLLFGAMIAAIEAFERETVVEPVEIVRWAKSRRMRGPDGGYEFFTYSARASVAIVSLRGRKTIEGATYQSQDDDGNGCRDRAQADAAGLVSTARAQVAVRASERDVQIYGPVRRFLENADEIADSCGNNTAPMQLTFAELALA